MSSTTINQILEEVQQKVSVIDDTRLYYILKHFNIGIRSIKSKSYIILKYAIAYHEVGVERFNANMLIAAMKYSHPNLWTSLHFLGDHHLITKLRGEDMRRSVWQLNPAFLKRYKEGETKE